MASQVKLPSVPNPKQSEASDYWARKGHPMLFQVLDPATGESLYQVLLALHVNPSTLETKMAKSKTVTMTYGGYVEFQWPDELDSLSAQASTGAFISPGAGLAAGFDSSTGLPSGSHQTQAWERQEDLLELFRSNGSVYNNVGQPLIRGKVLCMFDRGVFVGLFTTFEVNQDDTHSFSFELSWEFKIESCIYTLPSNG
jgi:hypothetical protein